MNSAVKTLTFAARWTNIALWNVVNLVTTHGNIRAQYMPGSERLNDDTTWSYDFVIQAADLPGGVTFDDIKNSFLVSPFVTAFAPCAPVLSNCFGSIPVLPDGYQANELICVVGPNDCGKWCLYRVTATDHDPYWNPSP